MILKTHCKDGGVPYSEAVHILIQQQLDSPIVGSMLRNPHTGNIHIEYYDIASREVARTEIDFSHVVKSVEADDMGQLESPPAHLQKVIDKVHLAFLQEVIDKVYLAFEGSGILDPGYVQQVEFGQPAAFLQGRPFMLKRPVEDFDVVPPELRNGKKT